MAWTYSDYPDSMKNLPEEVRQKAIEIANVLLKEQHMNEGVVIATAISRAKSWTAGRHKANGRSGSGDEKEHDADRYVFPAGGHWTVQKDSIEKPESVEDSKEDAVRKARVRAKKDKASLTVKNSEGRIEERISFNTRNPDPKQ